MRGFERKRTLKKLREICAIYHIFLSNLTQLFLKKKKKNLNSVVKEGLGACCVTPLSVFVKIKQ